VGASPSPGRPAALCCSAALLCAAACLLRAFACLSAGAARLLFGASDLLLHSAALRAVIGKAVTHAPGARLVEPCDAILELGRSLPRV